MAGMAVTQAPLPGLVLTNGGSGGGDGVGALPNGLKPSDLNDIRISVVIDRLNQYVRGQRKSESDAPDFFNLCLNLSRVIVNTKNAAVFLPSFHISSNLSYHAQAVDGSRQFLPFVGVEIYFLVFCSSLLGIDVAIANHQFPSRAQDLPSLVKQVCQCKNNAFFHAYIMVLMISVKGACQSGWFSHKDSEELKNLAKKIADGFGNASLLSAEPSCTHSVISTVMSRFYPRMKMGHVFVFLEIKPGFEAYLSDFQIPKNLKKTSPGDKIMLFVVQTDNTETSSCLVSPAKVNFLLNGKGVEGRTNIFVDNGPQIPTAVTSLLKYGPNLFQAVGEFNGNYIIGIAIMSEMPSPDSSALQDYEQHAPTTVDSDSELIEGPSRISLNCPISFTRVRTPVKGHSCKHIQCFDFDNYVGINSRRPFWRCPHCNQNVCFTDLRIDQKLVKASSLIFTVLKKAEANVADITIYPDGSWNPATGSDDAIQKHEDKCESPQPETLLDLTQTDDVMDFITTNETEDRKFPINVSKNQFTAQTVPVETHTGSTDNNANQRNNHVEDDFWSGVYVSPFIQENEEIAPIQNTNQLQQYQFGNSNFTAEYGMCPVFPRNVTRVPTAVQALPAPASSSVLQQRFRGHLAANTQVSPAAAPVMSRSAALRTHMSSSPPQQYSVIQENSSFPSVRPTQQIIGLPVPNQVQDIQRALERQRSVQQMSNLQLPGTTTSQPSSANFLQTQPQVSPTNTTMQMAIDTPRTAAPSYRVNPSMYVTPSMTDQRNNTRVVSPPLLSTDDYDQNWRPVGRMRGALSGQAYADAYNRFFSQNQPNQQPLNYPSARPGNLPGGSGNFPNGSSGMQ
ncbi:zinc finger miz domain-containing protein 2 [Phtheirospermum japonicum]|uniref:Zinc finger miz domain-containing protein 2 n=1 Tax=Phtheirospermum japonicum TaxID=374723 RepID=A0A830BN32_9LAMI|nr:zinc finger miz domain-containing protein 2 [Phtheirospermum japonicum]